LSQVRSTEPKRGFCEWRRFDSLRSLNDRAEARSNGPERRARRAGCVALRGSSSVPS